MASLREQVGRERDRLVLVRKAWSAALEDGGDHGQDHVPFYIAVADYLEAAMGRLHAQDSRLSELLPKRAADQMSAVQEMLKDVHERLEGSRKHLKALTDARQTLKAKGAAAIKEFESASRAYTDYIKTRMGHQARPSDLARSRFTEADWTYMAGATEEDIAREGHLFDKVKGSLPAKLKQMIP